MRSNALFMILGLGLVLLFVRVQTQPVSDIWQPVRTIIDNNSNFPEGAVLVGSDDLGIVFNYTKGGWSQKTKYLVASASKLVSTTAIWYAIQQGKISVTDKVQQYIPWWTSDSGDSRSNVTLANLMAFNSGFEGDTCNYTYVNLTTCVKQIYNTGLFSTPGSRFAYGGDHLQVAGLMVLHAVGLTDWNDFFNEYMLSPLGIETSTAQFVPPNCPLVAGGLFTDAGTYLKLLQSVYTNVNPPMLNLTTRGLREKDWNSGVPIEYSPVSIIGQEWHYASSFWVMCPNLHWNSTCDTLKQYASPGKYGYMPMFDRINNYWILAATYRTVTYAFAMSTNLVLDIQPTIVQNILSMRAANPSASPTPEETSPSSVSPPMLPSPSTSSSEPSSAMVLTSTSAQSVLLIAASILLAIWQ